MLTWLPSAHTIFVLNNVDVEQALSGWVTSILSTRLTARWLNTRRSRAPRLRYVLARAEQETELCCMTSSSHTPPPPFGRFDGRLARRVRPAKPRRRTTKTCSRSMRAPMAWRMASGRRRRFPRVSRTAPPPWPSPSQKSKLLATPKTGVFVCGEAGDTVGDTVRGYC